MEPIRIEIPNAKPQTVAHAAGAIIMDALIEAGMNPRSAAVFGNPMVRACLSEWGRGDMTRAEFIRAMRNLLILNPKLGQ